jgi:hypothetical protein
MATPPVLVESVVQKEVGYGVIERPQIVFHWRMRAAAAAVEPTCVSWMHITSRRSWVSCAFQLSIQAATVSLRKPFTFWVSSRRAGDVVGVVGCAGEGIGNVRSGGRPEEVGVRSSTMEDGCVDEGNVIIYIYIVVVVGMW